MKCKLVEVEWLDAQSSLVNTELFELEQLKPLTTISVGKLVISKKDWIVLVFTDFGDGMFKHFQLIPRGMIKKIKELRK